VRKLVLASLLGAAVSALATGSLAIARDDGARRGGNHGNGKLNGYQEVPSKSTLGFGKIKLRIDDRADLIRYVLTYEDLENDAFAAHIHFGQRSVNGGISAFLCGGGDKPPCPLRAGTVTGEIDPTDVIGPSTPGPNDQGIEPTTGFDEFVRAIRLGHTYANVHTSRFQGGEIRGQINDADQREFTGRPRP
jgi:hypothetical protein